MVNRFDTSPNPKPMTPWDCVRCRKVLKARMALAASK